MSSDRMFSIEWPRNLQSTSFRFLRNFEGYHSLVTFIHSTLSTTAWRTFGKATSAYMNFEELDVVG